ncbi:MAG: hypothetical protein QXN87_08715 [Candidatus Bathyarchaeia archaeon]
MGKRVFTTNWHIYKVGFSGDSELSEKAFLTAILKLEDYAYSREASSMKNSGLQKKFSDLFLEAVDETLASLGEPCRQSVYLHLENNFRISREDIPSKIEEFAKAVENIFGFGAKLIEIEIMKRLHAKIGGFKYYPKDKNLSFTQYATTVKMLHHLLDNNEKLARAQGENQQER